MSSEFFLPWGPVMAVQQRANSAPSRPRGRGRPFQPGQSGNPKGRPAKGTTIAECIRLLGGENSAPYVQRLHAIAFGDSVRALSAIAVLLERYGKAPHDLGTLANPDVSRMSDQELNAEILRVAADITARTIA
jgi:hypothetical protein